MGKVSLREFIENHIREYHEDMSKEGNRPTLSPSSRARDIIQKIKDCLLEVVE